MRAPRYRPLTLPGALAASVIGTARCYAMTVPYLLSITLRGTVCVPSTTVCAGRE